MAETAIAPVFVRVPQFCAATGMSRAEVYRHLIAGTLRSRKVGKSWYIVASEIEAFFERMNEGVES